ncbi:MULTISPECIES: iron-containing alcohol dehydrogenase [Streptomyces]|uniref:Iron-containing alcohol dehydrogenase n=1 Tax=Streptomyces doudnae TaxID=3075536 RepID=A0ABD5EXK1_9ACTN|nr:MULTISPECIES: iron-containing alcohol dehydrogenase [unclassified Streptomyces]MDT0439496.1 iron-containing alcohol dehydrogenase [Streptomyces sp. DSM 41981]MYQ69270.1 iron-containing alcohol dehydrogenase [Streptomyces sp. SID4950]SCE52576.1 Alcohol dehydrogenase, class IV [Streptomyces sp. SolWspMP-5a-2]
MTTTVASVALPRLLRIGPGAADQLGEVLDSLGLSRPLIVTDAFLTGNGTARRITDGLTAHGIHAQVYDGTRPDPTVSSVLDAVAVLTRGDFDCVVGLGGGSPMDTAKAVALLGTTGRPMREYAAPAVTDTPALPLVAVPTTAGSGSECTRYTIITDDTGTTDEKMLCSGLAFLPTAAFVDPLLTVAMPPRLTADTGIDALTHAIESYVGRRATPFTDGLALTAMAAIGRNLRTAHARPDDLPARAAMMLASTQAGMAFSNASVALVHGMSRPVGAHFHVAHGLSNAMLLPAVTAYSLPAAVTRYADCARAMALSAPGESDEGAAHALLAELRALNADLAVPSPERYGIDRDRWLRLTPTMAEQALASGSPAHNPRVPDRADIERLYRSLVA